MYYNNYSKLYNLSKLFTQKKYYEVVMRERLQYETTAIKNGTVAGNRYF